MQTNPKMKGKNEEQNLVIHKGRTGREKSLVAKACFPLLVGRQDCYTTWY